MDLTYLGHSAFQLTSSDVNLLVDPWIEENPACDHTVADFGNVTAVLVTHGAHDHIGDAPEIARRTGADLFCDPATAIVLGDRGFPKESLRRHVWGMHVVEDEWSVRVLEAHHLSAWQEEGVIGPPNAYVVTLDDTVVYHMGDTAISRDFEVFGDLYEPDVTLIPVGGAPGNYPELYPDEAALAAEWIGSPVFVPMHYTDGDRAVAFERACRDRDLDAEIRIMEPGDTATW